MSYSVESALEYYVLVHSTRAAEYESQTSLRPYSYPPENFLHCLSVIKLVKKHDYEIRGIGSAMAYNYAPEPEEQYRSLTKQELNRLSAVCHELEKELEEKGLITFHAY